MKDELKKTIEKIVDKLNDGCYRQMTTEVKEILDEFTNLGYSYKVNIQFDGDEVLYSPFDIIHLEILNIEVRDYKNQEYSIYTDFKFDKTFWSFEQIC